ncbi:hypothetical protein LTR28_011824, partial [Elasticomyces elasticus]
MAGKDGGKARGSKKSDVNGDINGSVNGRVSTSKPSRSRRQRKQKGFLSRTFGLVVRYVDLHRRREGHPSLSEGLATHSWQAGDL